MSFSRNDLEATSRAFNLFRRCVECPTDVPQCPTCPGGQVCTQMPLTCDQCPYRTCVPDAQSGATNNGASASNGPNVGAIAGGVVGGVAAIAIATYLIWRFFLKDRRRKDDGYQFEPEQESYAEKERRGSAARRAARASTHTVHSIASTVMTRASNVIPIAFIPGITSRRDVDEDAPPVPAVPLQHQHSNPGSPLDGGPAHNHLHSSLHSDLHHAPSFSRTSGSRSPYVEEGSHDHYFLPSDLRFSTFSDDTESYRRSRSSVATSHFTRQSLTPSLMRQSIASTIYGDQVEATPARTATRGRANVVSVHGSSRATPTGTVPEVPQIDYLKYGAQPGVSDSGPAGAGPAGAGPTGAAAAAAATLAAPSETRASSISSATNRRALTANSTVSAMSEDEDEDVVGELAPKPKPNLTAAIEEAARRASRQPTHGGLGSLKRDPSPFSDQHAVS